MRLTPFISFLVLLYVLALPLWVAAAIVGELPIPLPLPLSAVQAVLPVVVALALLFRDGGVDAVSDFLRGAARENRISLPWLFPALALAPLASLGSYLLLRVAGVPLPEPETPLAALPVYLLVFFISGLTEELGWQRYAFERAPGGWSALQTAIVLGIAWAVWHGIPYVQGGHNAWWLVWQVLVTVAMRIIIVWLYVNNGRSVFIATLFHLSINVGVFMFPNYGSHYDPFTTFVLILPVTVAIVIQFGHTLTWKRT